MLSGLCVDRLWDGTAAGRLRTRFSVDLYNAPSSSAIQAYNQAFIVNGAWLTPTLVLRLGWPR